MKNLTKRFYIHPGSDSMALDIRATIGMKISRSFWSLKEYEFEPRWGIVIEI